ncbi:MAG TPA: hypothetical protein P5075_12145 [Eubacteriales bacterium]|nr:hypothetical protein [Eubacteriales bacterium]
MKYTPSKRRWNLDATSFGPALKLVVALLLLAGLVLLTVYTVVPFLTEKLQNGGSLFSKETETAVVETPAPTNPILANQVKTVQYGEGYGLPAAVVDPSVYENEILFATGESEDACDRLVRLEPETGAFETVEVQRTNDTLRCPVENADVLVYLDAKLAGGGSIRMLDKLSGETSVLAEYAYAAPHLSLEAPYLVWTEHTGETTAKLMVCNIETKELLTLAVFEDSSYADSEPSIKSGQVIYADADETNPDDSLIRTVLLSDGSRWDYSAGTYVHDPKSAGDRWAYLTGNHDGDSDLYVSVNGGSPKRIARGVIDFDITLSCVVYSRDETVYAYTFSDDKTFVLSETSTNSQFVMAGGDYALWRDMTDPDSPLWKYIKVV